jgi:predicted XRE-type DNA-binding protein
MKRVIPDDEVTVGTGNIWLDMGWSPEEAEVMSAKVWLTKRIHDRIKELGLTQVKAAKQLGVSQPDVSRLMNIRPTHFSTEKLMSFLRALQLDTDIVIRPKRRKTPGPGVMRVMEAAPA